MATRTYSEPTDLIDFDKFEFECHGAGSAGPVPLRSLNPADVIADVRVRVVNKSDVVSYTSAKTSSTGTVANAVCVDSDGEFISITFWNDLVKQLFDELVVGKVYHVSGVKIKHRNREDKYSTMAGDFELVAEPATVFQPDDADDVDDEDIPVYPLERMLISHVCGNNQHAVVDVLGVVVSVNNLVETKNSRSGKTFTKRRVVIVDESGESIPLTLTGTAARKYDRRALVPNTGEASCILLIRGAVNRFQGSLSLDVRRDSVLVVNPDPAHCPAVAQLKKPRVNKQSATPTTPMLNLAQVADWKKRPARVLATVVCLNPWGQPHEMCYRACNREKCLKKVVETDGEWRCTKCNVSSDQHSWAFSFRLAIMDSSGQLQVQFFDRSASELLGVTATEAMRDNKIAEVVRRLPYSTKVLAINIGTRQAFGGGTERSYTVHSACDPCEATLRQQLRNTESLAAI